MAESFLSCVERWRDPLIAYCRHLLWNPSDLEDALQEMLITGHRKFARLEPGSDFRAWVFRIATLTCYSFNRRHRRRPNGALPSDAPAREEHAFTSEEIIENPAAIVETFDEETARACRQLNENQRTILLLKAVGGLRCVEIADVLDVPLGTVQGLLTRGRMRMRDRLKPSPRAHG